MTFLAGLVGSFSIAGLPLFNGYVSKAWIKAGIDSGILYYGLQAAGVLTSLIFIKVLYFGFLAGGERTLKEEENFGPPPLTMRMGMIILILLMSFIALNPAFMEEIYAVNPDLQYSSSSGIISGVQPFMLALILFPFLKKYIEPYQEECKQEDYFTDIGYSFLNLATKTSDIHSGNLIRYLSWALLALIILKFSFMFGA